jgi:uncharacterized membrane protein YbhN (UPF0104 family)
LTFVSKKLRLAGSVALLAFLAWRTDWRHIAACFAGLRAGWWLAAFGLYAVTQLVSSLRWRLLAGPLGFRRSFGQFFAIYYIGMFFNLVLPTSVGGDVVRAWYLDGRSGRKAAALLSVLADRVSGLLMLVAIACVASACSPLDLSPRVLLIVYGAGAGAVAGMLMLLALGRRGQAGTPYSVLSPPTSVAGVPGQLRKLRSMICELHFAMFPSLRLFLLTTLLSVLVQAANVMVLWLDGLALGVDVPSSYYWILVPVVTLVTLFPISVNGMGVREWATVLMLAPLGVASEAATALAFLWFLTFSAVSLAGAGFYMFGHFPRFEVRPDDEPVRSHPDQGREGQSRAAA